jgi:hypothetical protein
MTLPTVYIQMSQLWRRLTSASRTQLLVTDFEIKMISQVQRAAVATAFVTAFRPAFYYTSRHCKPINCRYHI